MVFDSTFEERLILDNSSRSNVIYDEHLLRYDFAKEFVKGKVVLDIACGSGYGSKILAEAGATKVIAVDVDAGALESARKNHFHEAIEYKAGDAADIGLEEKTVDTAVSFETIEHLEDSETFLKELSRVVKDDGLVIISTPNVKVSGAKNPFHFKEFEKEEFASALKRYFPNLVMAEQTNAVASFLKISGTKQAEISLTNPGEPSFFVAICSKSPIVLPVADRVSLNPQALENLYKNPGKVLADKAYTLLSKVPGAKKVFDLLR